MQFLNDEIKEKHGIEYISNSRRRSKLRSICEKLKKDLSLLPYSTVDVENIDDDNDFRSNITRDSFNDLTKPLLDRFRDNILKVLKLSNSDIRNIDHVILAGGSTRLIAVQDILEEIFGQEKINRTLNSDECQAQGATLYSEILSSPDIIRKTRLNIDIINPTTTPTDGRFSLKEISTMVERLMYYDNEKQKENLRLEKKNNLESLLYDLRREQQKLSDLINQSIERLEMNTDPIETYIDIEKSLKASIDKMKKRTEKSD
eukprot:TRINITY_DN3351_c0_g1_i2.p1 TRINITY_DN3351_c0_g1~~TRINITY_DN3351_c0_g1_i2.p1  ORF type:complete len:260 (-),score=63.79 TRINITY_DN3351_c0_g1_i2:56-835(-)